MPWIRPGGGFLIQVNVWGAHFGFSLPPERKAAATLSVDALEGSG
jgi:hypothetical protein